MTEDPFARFERSRGGLLIPVFLFLCGAFPTAVAVRHMNDVEIAEQRRRQEQVELRKQQEAEAANRDSRQGSRGGGDIETEDQNPTDDSNVETKTP